MEGRGGGETSTWCAARRRTATADRLRWRPTGIDGGTSAIDVPAGAWGLTVCQVPVVMTRDGDASFEVEMVDGTVRSMEGPRLGRELSAEIFARTGRLAVVRARV